MPAARGRLDVADQSTSPPVSKQGSGPRGRSRKRWTTGFLAAASAVTAVLTCGATIGLALEGLIPLLRDSTPTIASVSTQYVPLSVTFNRPTGDNIKGVGDTFTGTVNGLQANETLWIFAKLRVLTSGKSPASLKPSMTTRIVAEAGPCTIVESIWTCANVWSSFGNSAYDGDYTLWVAVLSNEQAYKVVNNKSLAATGGVIPEPNEPDHIGNAIDHVFVEKHWST